MTAATFILMYKQPADAAASAEALKFFAWAYAKGGDMAKELVYIPMPDAVAKDIEAMWAKEIVGPDGKPSTRRCNPASIMARAPAPPGAGAHRARTLVGKSRVPARFAISRA